MKERIFNFRLWAGIALTILLAASWVAGKDLPASPAVTPAGTPAPMGEGPTLVILGYHQFGPKSEKGNATYRVDPAEFRRQLGWIRDHGWTPVRFDQVLDFYGKGTPLTAQSVLITFDDGFRTIYTRAFPIMKEFGDPGVLFLYTDFIRGKAGAALKLEDVDAMAAGGFAVESHSQSHPNMSLWKDEMAPEAYLVQVKGEVAGSRDFLRDRFKATVEGFAYPYGVFNDDVLGQVKAAGYKLGFTVNPGTNDRTTEPLLLHRELVTIGTKPGRFASFFEPKVLHLEGLIPRDGSVLDDLKPVVEAKILDDLDPKTLTLRFGDEVMKGLEYDPAAKTFRYAVKVPLARGGHMLTLTAKDRQGRPRSVSAYFRIKKIHPAGAKTASHGKALKK